MFIRSSQVLWLHTEPFLEIALAKCNCKQKKYKIKYESFDFIHWLHNIRHVCDTYKCNGATSSMRQQHHPTAKSCTHTYTVWKWEIGKVEMNRLSTLLYPNWLHLFLNEQQTLCVHSIQQFQKMHSVWNYVFHFQQTWNINYNSLRLQ